MKNDEQIFEMVIYMEVFSNYEFNILRIFEDWSVVSEKDEIILNRYASIGFVKFGFDWDNMKETAKLTDLGLKHL